MWLSIAQWGNLVYVGDTDDTWQASYDPDCADNVRATHISNYIEAVSWARKVRENVGRDDWVCLDMADKIWTWAQEHYHQQMSGDDEFMLGDVYLENQKSLENHEVGMGGAHGANWGVIYKYYHGLLNMILNMPCHKLFVAGAREIRKDTAAPIVAQYKACGFYPAGPPNENELAHNFHSILFCAEVPGKWIYTSIKERGPLGKPTRRLLKGEEVVDFTSTYLFGVAGWQM